MTKLIVLDCDGVLVDYASYYGKMYEKIFNKKLTIANSKSYHPENYYGFQWENNKQKNHFMEQFNIHGWHDMQALEGAVESTQKLKKSGYKILVLTSIPAHVQEKRHQNLLDLGMPIDATIACGFQTFGNPKKSYIEALTPEYFVDDLKSNFKGIRASTKHVLIEVDHRDSPNRTEKSKINIHHTVGSLKEFVDMVLKIMERFNFNLNSTSGYWFEGNLLESILSPHQKIDIIEVPEMGKLLCLDNAVMVEEKDRHEYHELIVHPSCIRIENYDKALIIGGGDGLSMLQLLKYPFHQIIQVELDEQVSRLSQKYFSSILGYTFHHPRAKFIYKNALDFFPYESIFDYIALDLTDSLTQESIANSLYTKEFFQLCKNHLHPHGIMVVQIACPILYQNYFMKNINWLKSLFPNIEIYGKYLRYLGAYQYFASCSQTKDSSTTHEKIEKLQRLNINDLKLYSPLYYKALLETSK